jgi:hypothetical protein
MFFNISILQYYQPFILRDARPAAALILLAWRIWIISVYALLQSRLQSGALDRMTTGTNMRVMYC